MFMKNKLTLLSRLHMFESSMLPVWYFHINITHVFVSSPYVLEQSKPVYNVFSPILEKLNHIKETKS
jgi:hypothetical protein